MLVNPWPLDSSYPRPKERGAARRHRSRWTPDGVVTRPTDTRRGPRAVCRDSFGFTLLGYNWISVKATSSEGELSRHECRAGRIPTATDAGGSAGGIP
jgi:hypothetical protein